MDADTRFKFVHELDSNPLAVVLDDDFALVKRCDIDQTLHLFRHRKSNKGDGEWVESDIVMERQCDDPLKTIFRISVDKPADLFKPLGLNDSKREFRECRYLWEYPVQEKNKEKNVLINDEEEVVCNHEACHGYYSYAVISFPPATAKSKGKDGHVN
ncbi:MAG: hypothetical protein LUB61_00305 [Eggerthellaceae bacterium]|nr:hypothetical protein [Eggerthellaceae bacterium]